MSHTRRTYGKTTAEANYYRAGLKPLGKWTAQDRVGALGETRIVPKGDPAFRARFDAAVAAYKAEGKHHGRAYTPASRELDECIVIADQAGWGSSAIGRRLYGGVNAASTGNTAIRRAYKRLAEHPLPVIEEEGQHDTV